MEVDRCIGRAGLRPSSTFHERPHFTGGRAVPPSKVTPISYTQSTTSISTYNETDSSCFRLYLQVGFFRSRTARSPASKIQLNQLISGSYFM